MTDPVTTDTEVSQSNTPPPAMHEIVARRVEQRRAEREAEAEKSAEAPKQEQQPERDQPAAEGEQDSQTEPTAEDASAAPEGDTGEGETGDEEPEQPKLSPPPRWDADTKALFETLSPEVQAKWLERDKLQTGAVTKAQQEAAEARKKAEDQYRTYTERAEALQTLSEQAKKTFSGRWDGMDAKAWADWFDKDPQQAARFKAQHDAEKEELSRVETERAKAEQGRRVGFLQDRAKRMVETGHPLADPKSGAENVRRLNAYAQKTGVPLDALRDRASADELAILWKAMEYDALQEKAKVPPKKPDPKPSAPPVRPGAAKGGAGQDGKIRQLRDRAKQSGKMDDAVAYRLAKRRAQQS